MEPRETHGEIGGRFKHSEIGVQVSTEYMGLATVSHSSSIESELPSYDLVIPALLELGIGGLHDKCQLTPGVPLKPMLAKPTKAIGEVLDRFENKTFTCEYKYDGERAQVRSMLDRWESCLPLFP